MYLMRLGLLQLCQTLRHVDCVRCVDAKTLTYQTKVHSHLMKREKPFHTFKLAVFKLGELRQGHQRRSELPPFGCHGISLLTPVYVEYPHQCRHLLPLPVGLHGSWQADEAVIGGLGTCAEVPLAGEVNVLLCLHAFHASGKKETDEGQELFHRCFR